MPKRQEFVLTGVYPEPRIVPGSQLGLKKFYRMNESIMKLKKEIQEGHSIE